MRNNNHFVRYSKYRKSVFLIGLASVIFIITAFAQKLAPQNHAQEARKDISTAHKSIKSVIHIQTPVSGGIRSIKNYISLARNNGIDILIITDHDNLSYEYAIHPFRWLIKQDVKKASVFTYGVNNYLSQFKSLANNREGVLLIDGVESTPFYYWSGSFQINPNDKLSRRELSLNNRGIHLLVIGLNDEKAYKHLPIIANNCSSFDAYHGDQGAKPYQELIDYVNNKNGVVIWAHPEASEKWVKDGVLIQTNPYPDLLLSTFDYTGFSVFAEGYQKVGRINGIWDQVLSEYCAGKRKKPVWAIGELDDYGNKDLNSVQTIFLIKTVSYAEVLNALKNGKVYTLVHQSKTQNKSLRLEEFRVGDNRSKEMSESGDIITCHGAPVIKIKLAGTPNSKATVKLVKNGKLLKEFNDSLPIEISFTDNTGIINKSFYRLDITDEFDNKIISNPIFVTKGKATDSTD
jgi:hypothetical protein